MVELHHQRLLLLDTPTTDTPTYCRSICLPVLRDSTAIHEVYGFSGACRSSCGFGVELVSEKDVW